MRRRRPASRVNVVYLKSRGRYVLRWRDFTTGQMRQKIVGATRRREAERVAAQWVQQLDEGIGGDLVSWAEFRGRYEDERLVLQRSKSASAWVTAANHVENLIRPESLFDADASLVSRFAAALRKQNLANTSIASYLRQLRTALNWAERIFPGYKAPRVTLPPTPRGKAMKGRPITGEEFERMLAATAPVIGDRFATSWRWFLRGLNLSGLRLDEALRLNWRDEGFLHIWGLEKRRPMLRIRAEGEKGNQHRLLPITPDFVMFLRQVPVEHRVGRVFRPELSRGCTRVSATASGIISAIGKAAGVKVHTNPKTGKVKYASAHDLRRSFGERWAARVRPIILKELMRHASIETTLRYYVGENAERTANEVWSAFSDQMGDRAEEPEGAEWP